MEREKNPITESLKKQEADSRQQTAEMQKQVDQAGGATAFAKQEQSKTADDVAEANRQIQLENVRRGIAGASGLNKFFLKRKQGKLENTQ